MTKAITIRCAACARYSFHASPRTPESGFMAAIVQVTEPAHRPQPERGQPRAHHALAAEPANWARVRVAGPRLRKFCYHPGPLGCVTRSPAERGCYRGDCPGWRAWLPGVHPHQCRAQAQRGDRRGKSRGPADDRGADHVAVDRVPPGAVPGAHPAAGQLRVAVAEDLGRPGELTECPLAPGPPPPALDHHIGESRAQPEQDLS